MKNFYLSFIIINIFALYGHSYPAAPIFENIDIQFIEACPALNTSVLLNKHSEYLSKCDDVYLNNAPKSIDVINLKNFLCIGVLEAYIRLCNAISLTHYPYLPQSDTVLKQAINEIETLKPDVVCNEFKQIYPTSVRSDILLPWMTVLNANLKEPICVHLCSDISQTSTNVLCSMLFYVNQHVKNITAQKHVATTNSDDSSKPTDNDLNTKSVLPIKTTLQIDQQGIANRGTLENGRETNMPPKHNQLNTNSVDATKHLIAPIIVPKKPETVINKDETKNAADEQNHVEATKEEQKTVQQQQNTVGEQKVPIIGEQQKQSLAAQPKVQVTSIHEKVEKTDTEPQTIAVQPKVQSTVVPQELTTPVVASPTLLVTVANNQKLNNDTVVEEKPHIAEIKNEISSKVSEEVNLSKVIGETKLGDMFDAGGKDTIDGQPEYDDEDDDVSPGGVAEKTHGDSVQIKPVDGSGNTRHFVEVDDSNFFSYFMFISVLFIFGYVVYHNKQKILALLLEGRRDRNSRRRPSTSSYRKLNSNLEEAVTSKCSGSASNVIY